MFRKYTVPAPSVPRRIRVKKNANGSRYVDYEVGRKNNREKKYNVPVRKTIGLLDDGDETRMYPNDNYFASFAVEKAPEHLTEKQRDTLDWIRRGNSRYYRAYEIKETLRLILRCTDRDEAERKEYICDSTNSSDVTDNVTDNVIKDVTKNRQANKKNTRLNEIMMLLKQNASLSEVAASLGVTKRTILRDTTWLKDNGYLRHEGSVRNGKWIIIKELEECE